MGGIKHQEKCQDYPERVRNGTRQGSSCLNGFIWILSTLTLFWALGFLCYVQFHEIHKLKSRLEAVEVGYTFSQDNTGTGIDADLLKIVKHLVKEEIKSNLPPHHGEPCGETSHDPRSHVARQVVSGQSCCSALQKPGYLGNSQEVVTAYIGQDVLLPCNSTGFPTPTVTLQPASDPTGANRYLMTSSGLEIRKTTPQDSGTFTCVVENVFGKSTKTIQLIVTDPVVVTTSPNNVVIKDGDTVVIRCDATGNPKPVVTWSHSRPDGTVLQVIGSVGGRITTSADNTLVITNAKASDAGSYTCTGSNQYEKDSATTNVLLNGKPEIVNAPKTQTVLEGDTVTIYCTVVSSPPSTVTWNFPLTGSLPPLNAHLNADNSVTLSNVDKYNSGAYTCTATNSQGTVTAAATLTVEKGVTVTASPHVVPMMGTEPVLNFQCTADGDPVPSTTWSKVGSPSLYGNSKYLILPGGNLIITSPSLSTDTGIYQCNGVNRNGNATDNVIVYSEKGAISCTATFSQIGCSIGMTCGATCPSMCSIPPTPNVYGSTNYASDSSVCLSAYHRGFLPTPGSSRVIFTHTASGTFTSSLSNGIQSQPHSAGDSNQFIKVLANSGSGNSLIG